MLMVMIILILMLILSRHLDESRHRWSSVAAEPVVLPLVSSVRVQSGEHFILCLCGSLDNGQSRLLYFEAPWSGGVLLMRTTVVVELAFG